MGVRYAVAAMQGWRVDMEDAHVVKLGLDDEPPFKDWAFFGVFDGHAGMKVAQHSSEHLLQSVLTTEQFKLLIEETKKSGGKLSPKLIKLLEEGVKDGFLTLDSQMKDRPDIHGENERSGTTATCALLTPTHIFLANLGMFSSLFFPYSYCHPFHLYEFLSLIVEFVYTGYRGTGKF